jgi:hypothetical protein
MPIMGLSEKEESYRREVYIGLLQIEQVSGRISNIYRARS